MQRNIIFKFLLFYIFLTIIISYIFVYNFNNTINNYLKEKTNSNYLNFQAIYNKNKDLANIIFKTAIQKEEVLKLFKDAYKSSQLEKIF